MSFFKYTTHIYLETIVITIHLLICVCLFAFACTEKNYHAVLIFYWSYQQYILWSTGTKPNLNVNVKQNINPNYSFIDFIINNIMHNNLCHYFLYCYWLGRNYINVIFLIGTWYPMNSFILLNMQKKLLRISLIFRYFWSFITDQTEVFFE